MTLQDETSWSIDTFLSQYLGKMAKTGQIFPRQILPNLWWLYCRSLPAPHVLITGVNPAISGRLSKSFGAKYCPRLQKARGMATAERIEPLFGAVWFLRPAIISPLPSPGGSALIEKFNLSWAAAYFSILEPWFFCSWTTLALFEREMKCKTAKWTSISLFKGLLISRVKGHSDEIGGSPLMRKI